MISSKLLRVFAAIICLSLCVSRLASQAPPNPFEKILSVRDNLKTLQFVVDYERNENDRRYKCRYYVWICNEKLRFDKISYDKPSAGDFYEREFVCKNCEGYHFVNGHVGDGNDATGKKSTSVQFFSAGDPISDSFDLVWRYVGVYPSGLSGLIARPELRAAMNYKVFVDNPKGHKITISEEQNNVIRLEIKYNTSLGSILNVYIDNAKTRAVRMTQTARDYEESVVHNYGESTQEIIPSRISRKVTTGHSIVVEEINISDIQLNQVIDPKVFTLAGFGLPDYTILRYKGIQDARDYPIWRNGKVDKSYTLGKMAAEGYQNLRASDAAVPDTPPPSFWARSWPYLVGAAVFAALGFFLLRKMRKPAD